MHYFSMHNLAPRPPPETGLWDGASPPPRTSWSVCSVKHTFARTHNAGGGGRESAADVKAAGVSESCALCADEGEGTTALNRFRPHGSAKNHVAPGGVVYSRGQQRRPSLQGGSRKQWLKNPPTPESFRFLAAKKNCPLFPLFLLLSPPPPSREKERKGVRLVVQASEKHF